MPNEAGKLIQEEERAEGSVPIRVYWRYAKAATLFLSFGALSGYVLRQVCVNLHVLTVPSGHVSSMKRVSTVDTKGTIWGSTAMLYVLL